MHTLHIACGHYSVHSEVSHTVPAGGVLSEATLTRTHSSQSPVHSSAVDFSVEAELSEGVRETAELSVGVWETAGLEGGVLTKPWVLSP